MHNSWRGYRHRKAVCVWIVVAARARWPQPASYTGRIPPVCPCRAVPLAKRATLRTCRFSLPSGRSQQRRPILLTAWRFPRPASGSARFTRPIYILTVFVLLVPQATMSDYEMSRATEVIKDRVYYIVVRAHPRPRSDIHFFTIDDTLVYWNFFLDFGPLNLGQTFRFCQILNHALKSKEHANKRIYYYSSAHAHKRTNAAWLCSAYRMMYMGLTPEQVRAMLCLLRV